MAVWDTWYLAVMFLLNVSKERGVAEVGLAARTLIISWFDGKT